MDSQNQVPAAQTQSPESQLPLSPVSPSFPESGKRRSMWKIVGFILMAIVVISAFLIWKGSSRGERDTHASTYSQDSNQQDTMNETISLLGSTYAKVFTLPANAGTDYTSESYEWVKGAETVENWKTLVTTHKLSPLDADKLSAESYAQNVVALQTKNGAQMVETSIINTQDAANEGIDISNPPYLLVYAYLSSSPSEPAEVNFQKIQNTDDGKVTSFIYAEKMQISTDGELEAFLSSASFSEKRAAVLLERFPY